MGATCAWSLPLSAQGRRGGINGGSGFAVACADGKYYSLDYVATEDRTSNISYTLRLATSAQQILADIERHLRSQIPQLGESLADFSQLNQSLSRTDETSRLWLNSRHTLTLLDDYQRIRNAHCAAGPQTQVIQAVIRRETDRGIIYEQDRSVLDLLAQTGPLQVSFTLLHEWLRDYVEDPDVILRVNQYLHSVEFFGDSKPTILRRLLLLGVQGLPREVLQSSFARIPIAPRDRFTINWDGILRTDKAEASDYTISFEICAGEFQCIPLGATPKIYQSSRPRSLFGQRRTLYFPAYDLEISGRDLIKYMDELERRADPVRQDLFIRFRVESGSRVLQSGVFTFSSGSVPGPTPVRVVLAASASCISDPYCTAYNEYSLRLSFTYLTAR